MNGYKRKLTELTPEHKFFIGIDSDGCAFDTMELKHKECFAPNTIKHWNLQAVSKYAREAAEFVNLYSKWRGINRWPALMMVFDLLRERPEVIARGVEIPDPQSVREFMENEDYPNSNDGLKAYMQHFHHSELEQAWTWTTAVNDTVADMVHGLKPFPYMADSLSFLADKADMIVVSATPVGALNEEWAGADIAKYVKLIAGQEMGTKKEHLEWAAQGKYDPEKILMIGDAPGDMNAAKAIGALFYPVNPGQEEGSWKRFYEEAMHKFLAGAYAGVYEDKLIAEFEQLLPEIPPWKN
jgi:phosphoglycolate phosphatase-like HAD superfamily hydrolase